MGKMWVVHYISPNISVRRDCIAKGVIGLNPKGDPPDLVKIRRRAQIRSKCQDEQLREECLDFRFGIKNGDAVLIEDEVSGFLYRGLVTGKCSYGTWHSPFFYLRKVDWCLVSREDMKPSGDMWFQYQDWNTSMRHIDSDENPKLKPESPLWVELPTSGPRTALTGIRVANFKGIGPNGIYLPIKPVTLLFGENSAGKSSILQAISYGRDRLRSGLYPQESQTTFEQDREEFIRLVYKHADNRSIKLGFDMELVPGRPFPSFLDEVFRGLDALLWRTEADPWDTFTSDEFVNSQTRAIYETGLCMDLNVLTAARSVTLEFTVRYGFVFSYEVRIGRQWIAKGIFPKQMEDDKFIIGTRINRRHPAIREAMRKDSRFREHMQAAYAEGREQLGVISDPGNRAKPVHASYAGHLIDEYEFVMPGLDMAFFDQIVWGAMDMCLEQLAALTEIGGIRVVPGGKGITELKTTGPDNWRDGSAAWINLNDLQTSALHVSLINACLGMIDVPYTVETLEVVSGKEIGALRKAVEQELQKKSERVAASNTVTSASRSTTLERSDTVLQLRLRDKRTGVLVTPDTVGTGIAQIVPILMSVCFFRRVCTIQQPELHLHPRVQSKLGDFFIVATRSGDRTFLIETHSEHLILRLLRRIRETSANQCEASYRLSADRVAVIYCEQTSRGVTLTELPMSHEGEFTRPWPKGFFDERAEDLL